MGKKKSPLQPVASTEKRAGLSSNAVAVAVFIVVAAIANRYLSVGFRRTSRGEEVDDYYAILGVSRLSSPQEVKSAYRQLALQLYSICGFACLLRSHPDKNKGCSECVEQFQKVAKAYETLSDPEKKSAYDSDSMVEEETSISSVVRSLVPDELHDLIHGGTTAVVQIFSEYSEDCVKFSPHFDEIGISVRGPKQCDFRSHCSW
jgi:hypothetical protein